MKKIQTGNRGENGSALLLAMILVFVGAVLVLSMLHLSAYQVRSTRWYRDWTSARFLAESVAKNEIEKVTYGYNNTTIPTNAMINDWNYSNKNVNMTALGLSSFGSTSDPNKVISTANVSSSTTPTPAGFSISTAVPTTITVNLTTTCYVGDTTYTLNPIITMVVDPKTKKPVTSLFDGNEEYSTLKDGKGKLIKQLWKVDKTKNIAEPPNNTDHFQVKFKNDIQSQDELSLAYTGQSLKQNGTYQDKAGCGYGIYYGMDPNSTADNPDGYVFQYDPGAGNYGSFFVKVAKQKASRPDGPGDNEWYPTIKDANGNVIRQGYYTRGSQDWPVAFEPNTDGVSTPSDSTNLVRVNLSVKYYDNTLKKWVEDYKTPSLEGMMDQKLLFDNANRIKEIDPSANIQNVKQYIDWCNKNNKTTKDWLFDILAQHEIQIEVDANGRHRISCDGVQILNFQDYTDFKNERARKSVGIKGSVTGVRAWNTQMAFYANPITYKKTLSVKWKKSKDKDKDKK